MSKAAMITCFYSKKDVAFAVELRARGEIPRPEVMSRYGFDTNKIRKLRDAGLIGIRE